MATTLIIPGLNSSGPTHWQSWFEDHIPGTVRVIQRDWESVDLPEWTQRIRRDISRTPGKLFIVAHSFGVLAAVQAANDHNDRISGALLVAPAEPAKFEILDDVLPQAALGFASVVVASSNDPWMTLQRAAHWADLWGSDLINLGEAGHINTEAGFGPWPEGLSLLERLRRMAEFRAAERVLAGSGLFRVQRSLRQIRTRHRVRSHIFPAEERRHLKQAAALLEHVDWREPRLADLVPDARGARCNNAL